MQTPLIKQKIKDAGVEPPSYMDLSRPSTLEQPDWDRRTFKAGEGVDLGSNSELTIGKEAVLEGSLNAKSGTTVNIAGELTGGIEADGSTITIGGSKVTDKDGKQTIAGGKVGGDINLKNSTLTLGDKIQHYIDKHDGANTTNKSESDDKLKYQQEVESGELEFYSVEFAHKISLDSSSHIQMGGAMSSASLRELVIGGSNASNYTPVKGSGKLTIENLEVSAEHSATFEPDTTVTKKFMIKSYKPENNPVLQFSKALTLDKDMDFGLDFTDTLQKDKKYELLSAPHITNYGAKFDKTKTSNGLYKNYTIEGGKLYMTLKDKQEADPTPQEKPTPPPPNPGNPGSGGSGSNPSTPDTPQEKQARSTLSHQESKVLDMLKGAPGVGLANKSAQEIQALVQKTNTDMQNISKASFDVSAKALQTTNELINSRVAGLLSSRSDVSRFRLAALENDAKPTALLVREAADAARPKNNAWANMSGAYFKDAASGGDLKIFGLNAGYDRHQESLILGANIGIAAARFSAQDLSDAAKIYSIGAYGFYGVGAHELQSNLNLSFISSKRSVGSEAADALSRGVLLSNYYKYKIALSAGGKYTQAAKPVLALEFGENSSSGFQSARYTQKSLDVFSTALGLGAEYSLASDANTFSAQFLAKKSFKSGARSLVGLSNANSYVDYELGSLLSYKLNLSATTKLAKNMGLSCLLSGVLDNDKNYGISSSLKLDYRF